MLAKKQVLLEESDQISRRLEMIRENLNFFASQLTAAKVRKTEIIKLLNEPDFGDSRVDLRPEPDIS